MKTFLNSVKKYFADFGKAVAKGDIWCKLSLLVLGAGYWGRKQIVKGILMTAIEVIVILFTGLFSINYIKDLNTLGTVQYEATFDPLTMKNTVNDYDNSLLILLYGIVGLLVIVAFIFLYISNMKAVYRLQLMKEEGEHINTFGEDVKSLFNGKFYITLLTLPSIGVIMMNIIPILFMSCVAFTNYDINHMPPNYLFTWVGLQNFKDMLSGGTTITFSYAFIRILAWTLIWAVLATFTTFIGGILLAKLINHEHTYFKKMWRSLFVVTIAIPQFVTLLLVSKMFSDHGIVNTLCSNIGLTGKAGLGTCDDHFDQHLGRRSVSDVIGNRNPYEYSDGPAGKRPHRRRKQMADLLEDHNAVYPVYLWTVTGTGRDRKHQQL